MIKEIYIKKKSLIHNLNFWTKFLCFLLLFPLSVFLVSPKLLVLLVFIFLVFLWKSKIGTKKFWSLSKFYILPIVSGIILLALLFQQGIFINRLKEGLILAIRFSILICFGILFAMTTSPIEIPAGLMKIKIPHKYGITIMVAFRMLPLISQKIQNIIDAQRARGATLKLSIKNLFKLPSQIVALIIPTLHSTLETSVKLSDTIISRGYNPENKITIPPSKIKKNDLLIFLASIIILLTTFIRI